MFSTWVHNAAGIMQDYEMEKLKDNDKLQLGKLVQRGKWQVITIHEDIRRLRKHLLIAVLSFKSLGQWKSAAFRCMNIFVFVVESTFS